MIDGYVKIELTEEQRIALCKKLSWRITEAFNIVCSLDYSKLRKTFNNKKWFGLVTFEDSYIDPQKVYEFNNSHDLVTYSGYYEGFRPTDLFHKYEKILTLLSACDSEYQCKGVYLGGELLEAFNHLNSSDQ